MLPGKSPSEAVLTRLLWREQIAALPRSIWCALRRLLRREPRWYYMIDGRVIGRLVSDADHGVVLDRIAAVHAETFQAGVQFGSGVLRAVHSSQQADA